MKLLQSLESDPELAGRSKEGVYLLVAAVGDFFLMYCGSSLYLVGRYSNHIPKFASLCKERLPYFHKQCRQYGVVPFYIHMADTAFSTEASLKELIESCTIRILRLVETFGNNRVQHDIVNNRLPTETGRPVNSHGCNRQLPLCYPPEPRSQVPDPDDISTPRCLVCDRGSPEWVIAAPRNLTKSRYSINELRTRILFIMHKTLSVESAKVKLSINSIYMI